MKAEETRKFIQGMSENPTRTLVGFYKAMDKMTNPSRPIPGIFFLEALTAFHNGICMNCYTSGNPSASEISRLARLLHKKRNR